MGLETATFIQGLDVANPGSTDPRKQGDDHLRLIKNVLKNTFPNASKAFFLPFGSTKTANFSPVLADMNTVFRVSTAAGAVTISLQSSAAVDGWQCTVVKSTNDTNPIFITPPVGTLLSGELQLTKTRRAIPGVPFTIYYDGVQFVVTRIPRQPVGALTDFTLAALPVGYEWANGQTLNTTNYPDYAQANGGSGVVVDMRSAVGAGRSDMGGVDNALLPGGSVLGAFLGESSTVLGQANLPNVQIGGAVTAVSGSITSATISGNSTNLPVTISSDTHVHNSQTAAVQNFTAGTGTTN